MHWRFISTSYSNTFSCCTFLFYLQYLKLSWFPIFHLEIRKPTWRTLLIVNSLGKDQYSSTLGCVEFQPIQEYQLLSPSDPLDTDYNWLYRSIQKFSDAKLKLNLPEDTLKTFFTSCWCIHVSKWWLCWIQNFEKWIQKSRLLSFFKLRH